jgi:hypothetical protein
VDQQVQARAAAPVGLGRFFFFGDVAYGAASLRYGVRVKSPSARPYSAVRRT